MSLSDPAPSSEPEPTSEPEPRPEPEPEPGAEDTRGRPPWAMNDAILRDYYDAEWGMPVRDERGLFERITLEAFQSGLSWSTILRKREAFRAAFSGFEPDAVAAYTESDVQRLLNDPGIVRNRRKIDAAITNARATVTLRDDGGLAEFVWSFRPETTPAPRTVAEIPTQSPESVALADGLRKRGFVFVGPVTMFALMAAIGMVDLHLVESFRRGSSGVWGSD